MRVLYALRTQAKLCAVIMSSTGEIELFYSLYPLYSFPCDIHVKFFPFDDCRCEMQLANWHMDDRYMNLSSYKPTVRVCSRYL